MFVGAECLWVNGPARFKQGDWTNGAALYGWVTDDPPAAVPHNATK